MYNHTYSLLSLLRKYIDYAKFNFDKSKKIHETIHNLAFVLIIYDILVYKICLSLHYYCNVTLLQYVIHMYFICMKYCNIYTKYIL